PDYVRRSRPEVVGERRYRHSTFPLPLPGKNSSKQQRGATDYEKRVTHKSLRNLVTVNIRRPGIQLRREACRFSVPRVVRRSTRLSFPRPPCSRACELYLAGTGR